MSRFLWRAGVLLVALGGGMSTAVWGQSGGNAFKIYPKSGGAGTHFTLNPWVCGAIALAGIAWLALRRKKSE